MGFLSLIIVGFVIALLLLAVKSRFASFSAQLPSDYADGNTFDIREHLNKPLLCEGVIYGPLGRVSSRFVANMNCAWSGDDCNMTEEFHYGSGNIQHRKWSLNLSEDGTIKATAPDVIGVGYGQQNGSAVVLNYRISLTPEAGGHILDVTDWMYLMENGTIMNRSEFRKFGLKVGELIATMRPQVLGSA